MSEREPNDVLADIHNLLALRFLGMLESGEELNSAQMSVIRQFLKDNDVEAVPAKGSPLEKLATAAGADVTVLPFPQTKKAKP